MSQKERIEEAKKNYEEIIKDIEKYPSPLKIADYSTLGKWGLTEDYSLDDIGDEKNISIIHDCACN
jgi:hypothetical protein